MIVLIAGASHTGKTLLAQRLLEKHGFPYLSIEHLKMGLIRSGQTALVSPVGSVGSRSTSHRDVLTPEDDDEKLTAYLWPIVREMIKTAVENKQNMIVEGCYIPFDWEKDFEDRYLREIKYFCLVMTESYIRSRFEDIKTYAGAIEDRLDDGSLTVERVLRENRQNLEQCRKFGHTPVLIDDSYQIEITL